MARNQETIYVPKGVYTAITSGSIAGGNITLVVSSGKVEIIGTVADVAPDAAARGLPVTESFGVIAMAIDTLFSAGDIAYLWARGVTADAEVYVDHA